MGGRGHDAQLAALIARIDRIEVADLAVVIERLVVQLDLDAAHGHDIMRRALGREIRHGAVGDQAQRQNDHRQDRELLSCFHIHITAFRWF